MLSFAEGSAYDIMTFVLSHIPVVVFQTPDCKRYKFPVLLTSLVIIHLALEEYSIIYFERVSVCVQSFT
jgi:hypothetical protein